MGMVKDSNARLNSPFLMSFLFSAFALNYKAFMFLFLVSGKSTATYRIDTFSEYLIGWGWTLGLALFSATLYSFILPYIDGFFASYKEELDSEIREKTLAKIKDDKAVSNGEYLALQEEIGSLKTQIVDVREKLLATYSTVEAQASEKRDLIQADFDQKLTIKTQEAETIRVNGVAIKLEAENRELTENCNNLENNIEGANYELVRLRAFKENIEDSGIKIQLASWVGALQGVSADKARYNFKDDGDGYIRVIINSLSSKGSIGHSLKAKTPSEIQRRYISADVKEFMDASERQVEV